jgi:hypothetical protein
MKQAENSQEVERLEAWELMDQISEKRIAFELCFGEGALRARLQNIAVTELGRQRRRLGAMAPEQVRALEELVASTVERISEPIVEKVRELYASGEHEKARNWCSILG